MDTGKESARNKDSPVFFDYEFVAVDDEEDDVDLDAKLFEDNVVEEKEAGYGDNANLFRKDKKMSVGNFDDDLHTPVGSND